MAGPGRRGIPLDFMSEYQYYEFQAVDRPLTQKEIRILRAHSSRARISPSGFVNFYNWGNFKGDPDAWMEKYFDAFCYLANWGTRWFMLRLPRELMPEKAVMAYRARESMSCRVNNGHLILSFFSDEEQDEPVQGETWMPALLPLREDLLKGDFRPLYLGWLSGVKEEDLGEQTPEPPVPPGLDKLTPPLKALADFLKLPKELLAAAAEKSAENPMEKPGEKQMAHWVARLPDSEKNKVLTQIMATGETGPALELRRRFLAQSIQKAAAFSADENPGAWAGFWSAWKSCADSAEKSSLPETAFGNK